MNAQKARVNATAKIAGKLLRYVVHRSLCDFLSEVAAPGQGFPAFAPVDQTGARRLTTPNISGSHGLENSLERDGISVSSGVDYSRERVP